MERERERGSGSGSAGRPPPRSSSSAMAAYSYYIRRGQAGLLPSPLTRRRDLALALLQVLMERCSGYRVEGSSLAPCSEASMTTYASTPKSTTTRRPGPSQQPQARRRAPPRQEHCGRSFRRARPELAPWEHNVSTQWRIQMHSCIKTAKPSIQWMCQWMFSDY